MAAVLKGHALWLDPLSSTNWFDTRQTQIFLILVENTVGVFLLFGLVSVMLWRTALLLYAAFLIYSFVLGVSGSSSCGCFGKATIHPWITFGLDALAIFLLWTFRQQFTDSARERPWVAHLIRHPVVFVLGSLLLLSVGAMSQYLVRPPADLFANTAIEPIEHDFGMVNQMEELQHEFQFINHLDKPVTITHLHSSCGCTTALELAGHTVAPRSRCAIPVIMESGSGEGKKSGVITVFFKSDHQSQAAWHACSVKSQVQIDYHLSADWIDFGTIEQCSSETRIVQFKPASFTEAKILDFEVTDQRFHGTKKAQQDGVEVLEMTFQPSNLLCRETVTALLTKKTNSPRVPVKSIVLQASTNPLEEIDTKAIVIGSDVAGTVKKIITLRSSKPTAYRVQCQHPNIHCAAAEGVVAGKGTLEIQVGEPATGQGIDASLELIWLENDSAQAGRRVVIPIHRLPRTKGENP